MRRVRFLIVTAFLFSFGANAQTITGTFPLYAGQEVRLESFYGFDTYLIGSSDVSEEGKFMINYSETGYGMGQLVSADDRPFILILSGEDIELKGGSFGHSETIKILKGEENRLSARAYYSEEQRHRNVEICYTVPTRKQALHALADEISKPPGSTCPGWGLWLHFRAVHKLPPRRQ